MLSLSATTRAESKKTRPKKPLPCYGVGQRFKTFCTVATIHRNSNPSTCTSIEIIPMSFKIKNETQYTVIIIREFLFPFVCHVYPKATFKMIDCIKV